MDVESACVDIRQSPKTDVLVKCLALLLCCQSVDVTGCYDGKVYVVDRPSGVVNWSYQTGGPVKSSASVNPRNSYAYIGSHDHHLYAFNIQVTYAQCQ